MAAHQAPLSLGFSRQEHWSGLPFPSPMHESESEVTQSCPTLSDPMDCSLPGSSVHGILHARVLEWGCHCLLTMRHQKLRMAELNRKHLGSQYMVNQHSTNPKTCHLWTSWLYQSLRSSYGICVFCYLQVTAFLTDPSTFLYCLAWFGEWSRAGSWLWGLFFRVSRKLNLLFLIEYNFDSKNRDTNTMLSEISNRWYHTFLIRKIDSPQF